ncbi:hypothetical protein C7293_12545 [filamentous cyanobacterium CCT1]|nr:hypothetical protein C7293_12545 [filamentous cyanobacterium CCT1]PSN79822.1 hypothetical protein C8B47_09720 [filamentous cyanobacterium CCP4]
MHDFGQSLAVVVGINQYQHGIAPLATAMTDAKAIAHILKEYHDYQVFSLIDEEATLSKLKELFQASLPSLVQPGDRLFVYFAGHGIALNGDEGPKGYLIPKDAVVGDTNTYLSMDELYQALMDLPCHHMLTVLDCCFAGGFRWSGTRNIGTTRKLVVIDNLPETARKKYHRFTERRAWQVITSCGADQVAFDTFTDDRGRMGSHSLFNVALQEALEGKADINGDKVITATELYIYLRDSVELKLETKYQASNQSPGIFALEKHDGGEYVFLTPDFEESSSDAGSRHPSVENLIAQSFKSDVAKGKDLLGIEAEVHALAEVLGMRALKPPLAVGILGGWGSGKSFVMHMMREKLNEIYQKPISKKHTWKLGKNDASEETSRGITEETIELSPYVGHIYQIYFNSWTYAKADLWSSLMQTIFHELNCQLTVERHLRETFSILRAVDLLTNKLASLKDSTKLDLDKIEKLINWLINNRNENGALLKIIDPKFWSQSSNEYKKIQKEQEELRKNTVHAKPQQQEVVNLKPSCWANIDWKNFKQDIDKYINEGASERWQSISCNDLHEIWTLAQEYALGKIREGGEIWTIVNSEITANERDEIIEKNGSLRQIGLLIWREIIASSRTQGVIWNELSNLRMRDQKELASIEKNFLAVQKNFENQKRIAELSAKQKLEYRKIITIWQPVLNQAYKLLGIEPAEIDTWKTLVSQLKTCRRAYIALGCLVALMIIAASPSWSERISALTEIIHTYLNIGKVWLVEVYSKYWPVSLPITGLLLQRVWGTTKQYLNEVKKAYTELDSQYQRWLQEEQEKSNLVELSQEVENLRLQVEQKRRQVGLIADQDSLFDFINNRLQEDSYSRRLGLIHQISRDLDGLSQRLAYNEQDVLSERWKHIVELFPRGPARVILYIDDLDRCPPDRVVDVLEAVQLLINTPLFVVVLAIDDRYIARALENVYKGVLKRKGHPSGIDYLEKIIQIPYRTRPIMSSAIENYLKNHIETEAPQPAFSEQVLQPEVAIAQQEQPQLEVEDLSDDLLSKRTARETFKEILLETSVDFELPPPQVVKLTPVEFATLTKYFRQVDLSPRTAKRLVNIYKILKILWFRSNRNQREDIDKLKEVVLALLILSGRYPVFMREVLLEISHFYEEQPYRSFTFEEDEDKTLKDCFEEPLEYLDCLKDPYLKREWKKFSHDIQRIIPLDLKLRDLGEENFNLVLSFCFVGDIGYDPEDYRIDDINSNDARLKKSD